MIKYKHHSTTKQNLFHSNETKVNILPTRSGSHKFKQIWSFDNNCCRQWHKLTMLKLWPLITNMETSQSRSWTKMKLHVPLTLYLSAKVQKFSTYSLSFSLFVRTHFLSLSNAPSMWSKYVFILASNQHHFYNWIILFRLLSDGGKSTQHWGTKVSGMCTWGVL